MSTKLGTFLASTVLALASFQGLRADNMKPLSKPEMMRLVGGDTDTERCGDIAECDDVSNPCAAAAGCTNPNLGPCGGAFGPPVGVETNANQGCFIGGNFFTCTPGTGVVQIHCATYYDCQCAFDLMGNTFCNPVFNHFHCLPNYPAPDQFKCLFRTCPQ